MTDASPPSGSELTVKRIEEMLADVSDEGLFAAAPALASLVLELAKALGEAADRALVLSPDLLARPADDVVCGFEVLRWRQIAKSIHTARALLDRLKPEEER